MRRGASSPPLLLAAVLLGLWLVLNQTTAPAQIVLGSVLALTVSWLSTALRPLRAKIRRPHVALALVLLVLVDIVRSNLAVARIVLGLARGREVRSGFLDIPLDLRDPHGLAALATIVTATPGTVWADLSADGRVLTLHVLDLVDEDEWVGWFKERYERRLMRVFE